MSYEGIVTRIKVRPHPDPKVHSLAIGSAAGYQLIVSKETVDGMLGVVFPGDGPGCLTPQFALANGLFRKHPVTNEPIKGGYLEANARVRSMKLRGVISEGIFIPLERIQGVDLSHLEEGDTVSSVGDYEICKKYRPKQQFGSSAKESKKKSSYRGPSVPHFYEVGDTKQVRSAIFGIPEGAVLYITEKLHGTSGRTGSHAVTREVPKTGFDWLKAKMLRRSLVKEVIKREKVSGTRRVVIDSEYEFGHPDEYRMRIHDTIEPRPGETIYYEIVGFDGNGKSIMSSHSAKGKGEAEKSIRKQYGEHIVYKYGQEVGTWDIYVYKIEVVLETGHAVTLSEGEMRRRASELGLKTVPLLTTMVYDGDTEALIKLCNEISTGASTLDSQHPREGICIRVESPEMKGTFKWKSFEFSVLEGIRYSDPDYVDLEDER